MNRRVILVVIAVALALTGTVVVYAYVKHADKRALADTRVSHVLVVETQIPAGTSWSNILSGAFVKQETVPTTAAPSQAIASVDDTSIAGTEVATAVIQPGQLLLRPMFSDQATVTGVLAIPKNMVAVSISLSGTADVAGYVQPQSQVAIFLTTGVKNGANTANSLGSGGGSGGTGTLQVTKLLMSPVRVIATSTAAPTDVTPKSGGGSAAGSVTLTLALSQQDAERIILSQSIGQLYLGLLSKDSQVSSSDGGITNVGHIAPAPIWVK